MKKTVNVLLFVVLPILYAAFMLNALFVSRMGAFWLTGFQWNAVRVVSLTPFETIGEYLSGPNLIISIINVLGNVVVFVPLGIYMKLLNRKMSVAILIVFITTICVEALQYALGLGSADIDDVILNVLGGVAGIYLCAALRKLTKDEGRLRLTLVVSSIAIVLLFFAALAIYGKITGMMIRLF